MNMISITKEGLIQLLAFNIANSEVKYGRLVLTLEGKRIISSGDAYYVLGTKEVLNALTIGSVKYFEPKINFESWGKISVETAKNSPIFEEKTIPHRYLLKAPDEESMLVGTWGLNPADYKEIKFNDVFIGDVKCYRVNDSVYIPDFLLGYLFLTGINFERCTFNLNTYYAQFDANSA